MPNAIENNLPLKSNKDSTLLNASKSTNFIYEIVKPRFSTTEIEEINQTKSFKAKISDIYKFSEGLKFVGTENQVFRNNLTLIDSGLPTIMAETLLLFYKSNLNKISDLIDKLNKTNPLGFDLRCNHPYYSYKIKRLLSDIALGMMPSKMWNGRLHATGGYLIVKSDGDVICYHIYNRNDFEDYLLDNTKLETASKTKHDFGKIFFEDSKYFIKLNLQIRFNA